MKIFGWSTHRYMDKINIFLIALALMAGLLGCTGSVTEYDLSIDNNTGGSVVTPGVGTFAWSGDFCVS